MSVSSITLKRKDLSRNHATRWIAIQLGAGNYVQNANGGFPVDFTTMANPQKIQKGKFGGVASSPNSIPATDDILPADLAGYQIYISQNAVAPTLKNYVLTIFQSTQELAAGAMPAGLQLTDIMFEIITPLKRD
jgi:hypothetical protein